jgi:hypothetical protein
MRGRVPTMAPPVYPPAYPAPPSAPTWTGQPSPWPAAWQQAAGPAAAPAQPLATPRPIVRAKGDDDPVRVELPQTRLRIPTPEQLGIALAPRTDAPPADWATARQRLDRLGAVCLHLEKLPQGGYRFTCLLATSQAGRTHRVEAQAATEAEVVRLALDRSEEWARGR